MNGNETALLDPFGVGTPDEATELTALTRALELAEGFSLIFVRCNQIPQRERLMGEVRTRLPKLNIQTIFFHEPIQHLLDSIQEQLTTPLPGAVFVSGLEFSLPIAAEAHATPLIANLNASRNSFAQTMPCPVVLWVPEYVLTAIAQGAPDFFSIRSGVYFFAAKPAEMADLTRVLADGRYSEVANLSLAEKRSRITALELLLLDYDSLPEGQRDYQAELRLNFQLGILLSLLRTYDKAMRHYQRALQLSQLLGYRAQVANLLVHLGIIHQDRGEYGVALEHHKQALATFEELGNRKGISNSLHNIGIIYQDQGDFDAAMKNYQRALAIAEELGDYAGVASSLYQIGRIYQGGEKYEIALEHFYRVLAIEEALNDHGGIASSLHQIGTIHQLRGEYEQAWQQYQRSLQIAEELGDRLGVASSLHQLGILFTETKRYADAFPLLLQSLMTFLELQSPNAGNTGKMLRHLRAKWDGFDAAWHEATGEEVPEWLLQEEGMKA
jgi:tetratricopeptide (TPR) repeat protein